MTFITVNGEKRKVEGELLLADLLSNLGLNASYFAVAVNDEVVPRSKLQEIGFKDGDRIEVIHAVGGG